MAKAALVPFLVLLCASLRVAEAQPCTICKNGETITKPEQDISLPEGTGSPIPIDDCAGLDSVAAFVGVESEECLGIQTFGDLCGCPSPTLPNEQCQLCPDALMPNPSLPLVEEEVSSIIQRELGQNQSLVSSNNLICQDYDTFLNGFDKNSSLCTASNPIRRSCGCPPLSSSNQCQLCPTGYELRNKSQRISSNLSSNEGGPLFGRLSNFFNRTDPVCGEVNTFLSMGNATSEDCAQAETLVDACGGCSAIDEPTSDDEEDIVEQVEMCSLCQDGLPTPWPEKQIENFITPLPTCGALDLGARSVPLHSEECLNLQALGKACGCNVPATACSMCRNKEMTLPNAMYAWANQGKVVELAEDAVGIRDAEFSCETFDSILAVSEEQGSQACVAMQLRGASCGCPDPRDTIAVVLKRVAAALSVMGSLFIVWDVLRDSKKLAATHHQLVLGVSFFDIISSVANLFGPVPLPQYSGTAGAVGSRDTCLALGFFTQLGQTASYFNLGLSLYFWLVICCGWRESTFRRIRYPVYGAVTLIGLVLAFAGLRYYEFGFHLCQVMPPPIAASWYPAIFFFIVPLCIVLAGTTLSTIAVLLEVRRREKAAMRFRSSRYLGDNQMHLTAKVFWKSVWYLSGFYITYPILFAIYFVDITDKTIALFFLSSALSPSQGFWNFCVYAYTYRRSDKKESRELGSTERFSPSVQSPRGSSIGDSNHRKRVSTSSLEEAASSDDALSNLGPDEDQQGSRDVTFAPDIGEDLSGDSADACVRGDPQSIYLEDTRDLELDPEDCDGEGYAGCNEYSAHYHAHGPRFS